jgi:Rieske Fe-S protein
MTDESESPIVNKAEGKSFTRRVFLKFFLGISAFLTIIPFIPMLSFFFTPKKEEKSSEKKIANIKDVPEGSTMVFFYPKEEGEDRSFLTHLTPEQLEKAQAEGRDEFVVDGFVALNSICTHLQCPTELPVGDEIICVCHGGYFDVIDGTVVAGPPPRPVPMVRLRIEPNTGDIYATELIGKIGYGRDV